MSGSVSSVEGELNAIVKEYLEFLGLEETALSFEEECRKLSRPIQDNAGLSRRDERITKIQNELFQYFDGGKRLEFFSAWESYISSDVRDGDSYCQKLEFQLHIYFAIFPLDKKDHWVKEEAEEAMFHFRYYLETKGAALSKSTELLPYFALPYVPSPNTHPSFKDIFQDTWISELRNRLETFLWEALKDTLQSPQHPRLVELYTCNDIALKDVRQELKSAEKRLEESEKRCVLQAKKLEKLQDDCQKLMAVTSHLITALESAVKGNLVDMDYVLSACAHRFPDVFKLASDSENTTVNTSDLVKNESVYLTKTKFGKGDQKVTKTTEKYFPQLDFGLLKKDLVSFDTKSRTVLLQALRWRLTKSQPDGQREAVLSSYINNDLLGCDSPSEYRQLILHMVRTPSDNLCQTLTRFLNALASFSKGRSYLSQCPQLLAVLQDNLLANQLNDTITRDMTLGTLQKLSMRHALQSNMIEADLVEWLIDRLEETDTFTDYGLEYAVALLMNLCLRSAGKKRCEPLKHKVLKILSNLLRHENNEILPYVNGALYSLLSLPSIKQHATETNLEIVLQDVMKDDTADTHRQLECVLKRLTTAEELSETSNSDDEDEDEEEVELEPELDNDDPVTVESGHLSGERLLIKNYAAGSHRHQDSISQPSASCLWNEGGGGDEGSKSLLKEGMLALNKTTPQRSPSTQLSLTPHSRVSQKESKCGTPRSSSVPPSTDSTPSTEQPAQPISEPVTPKLDYEATELVRKITGECSKTIVEAANIPNPASVNIKGLSVQEYTVAFSSRPKIPRTPEPSSITSPASVPKKKCHREMSPKISASSPPRDGRSRPVGTSVQKKASKR